MGLPSKSSAERYSYRDYLQWDDDERWELIDGVPYNMTPAPSRKHQEILRQLLTCFAVYLEGKTCKVYPAPFDVRLADKVQQDEDIIHVVQPDITVVCDPSKLDDRGCKGTPDLLVEIISPSTSKKDRREKYILYEKFGVKEYWIVDPSNESVEIYHLQSDGKFERPPEVFSKEDTVEVKLLEDFKIDLSAVFTE